MPTVPAREPGAAMLSLAPAGHIAATVGEENVESSYGKALTLARGFGM